MTSQLENKNDPRKISNKLCAKHSLDYSLLYTDPSNSGIAFKCEYCSLEESLETKHLLSIRQLKESDFNTVLFNWPHFNPELLKDIKELANSTISKEIQSIGIADYFKDLRIQILKKIDDMQLEMEQKYHLISDFKTKIIELYNKASQKEALKKILLDNEQDANQLSANIREIVVLTISNQQKNEKELQEMIKVQKNPVNFERANLLKNEILDKLSQINLISYFPQESIFKEFSTENIQWEWIKTNYQSSEQLEFQQIENGVTIIQPKKINGNAVTSFILDNNLVYQLTCKVNKPLNCNAIRLGLILNDKIHSRVIGSDYGKDVYRSVPGYGGRELIKGDYLNSENLRKEVKQIIFRFCVSSKSFYYFDIDCKNINKVEANLIDDKAQYRFGVGFYEPGDDFKVSIMNVNITKDKSIVDKF